MDRGWLLGLFVAPALACSSPLSDTSPETSSTPIQGTTTAPADPAPPPTDSASDAGLSVSPTDDASVEAGTPPAASDCATNTDCTQGDYCKKAACGDALGTCTVAFTSASACFGDSAGSVVCGCDHVTYADACWAAAFGVNVATQGDCVLPLGGACASQADCGGAAYASTVFCNPAACGSSQGTCAAIPGGCPELLDPVCGCDGTTYNNACFAHMASAGVAYGGACHASAITPCASPEDCAGGETCAFDPSTCSAGERCSGVCLARSAQACVAREGAAAMSCSGINEPSTQACALALCAGGSCPACIFTTGVPCGGDAPCPAGELCIPAASAPGNTAATRSFCVQP